MTDKNINQSRIKRRDFIKYAGAGVAAASFTAGCQSTLTKSKSAKPLSSKTLSAKVIRNLAESGLLTHQVIEADVVVVVGGMAGVLAGIAAARNGASVVLVRRSAGVGGECVQ